MTKTRHSLASPADPSGGVDPPLRILHVISGYLPHDCGGTQQQLRELCRAQQGAGHEVSIFTRHANPETPEFELASDRVEGIPVTRVNNTFRACDAFEKTYRNEAIDSRFLAHLTQVEPDIVHVHHLTCLSTSLIRVVKDRGVPVVQWLSDYWTQCLRGQRLHPDGGICESLDRNRCLDCLNRLLPHLLPVESAAQRDRSREDLERWEEHIQSMIALCDAVLFPSAFHRKQFAGYGIDPDRSHLVEYGLDTDRLAAPARGRRPIERIGYLGTIIPSKGVHLLVEAFQRLGRRELRLDIYGEFVPFHEKVDYLEELEAAAEGWNNITFHGRYEATELPTLLQQIDLLVVPSLWWESYCLTAREGALAGIPVVAFPLAGLEDAVSSGLALGSPVGDVEGLASTIARLLEDESLRDTMSRQGRKVRDSKACAEQIEGIYRELLAATSGPSASRGSKPEVTVFIPTWNAGPEFPEILQTIQAQTVDREFEILVIDSGSTDGTVEYLKSQPVRLLEIANGEFNHGLTRRQAIEEANGEIVVLTVQDARPANSNWLQGLVDSFVDDRVAGAYSAQRARHDANIFIKDRLRDWAPESAQARVQRVEDRAEFESLAPLEKLRRVAFDDVSSSVRRSVALEIPFRERAFGEDLDWAHRVILAGHHIVFQPASKVIHSHDKSIWYEFKRVYADHQNLHRLFGVHTVPRLRDVAICSRGAVRHLWSVTDAAELGPLRRIKWKLRAIPFGWTQNLAQYLGARSVHRLADGRWTTRLLDRWLQRAV